MGFAGRPNSPLPWHHAPPIAPHHLADDASDQTWVIEQMIDWVLVIGPKSGADALRELRHAFPDIPLALRVTALEMLMSRSGQ